MIWERIDELPVESELSLECTIRAIEACEDVTQLKRTGVEMAQQVCYQDHFIDVCLTKIAGLQAKLISSEYKVKQPKRNWLQKLIQKYL